MAQTLRVAFITDRDNPNLIPDDQTLIEVIHSQVAALQNASCAAIDAQVALWDDATVQWEKFDAVVIRSPWDYFVRYTEFMAWLDKIQRCDVALFNPVSVIRWNSNKTYLREFDGIVPQIPTLWVPCQDTNNNNNNNNSDAATSTTLAQCIERYEAQFQRAEEEYVFKPSISAGAYSTVRFKKTQITEEIERTFQELIRSPCASPSFVLIQPFTRQIVEEGEISFLFFGGEFSHACLKCPASGDFRVQATYGGRYSRYEPTSEEIAEARAALEHLPKTKLFAFVGTETALLPLLYARVDMVRIEGKLHLVELELIEPALFFKVSKDDGKEGMRNFANALISKLGVISAAKAASS